MGRRGRRGLAASPFRKGGNPTLGAQDRSDGGMARDGRVAFLRSAMGTDRQDPVLKLAPIGTVDLFEKSSSARP